MKVKLNMKRIFLFVVTNLAVVLVLGVVASLLGVNRFLTSNGLDLTALLGYALISPYNLFNLHLIGINKVFDPCKIPGVPNTEVAADLPE